MDLVFLGGCLLVIMAFPAMVGAMADGSPPRGAFLLILFGGALIGVAVWQRPGDYSFEKIPDILIRVIGQAF